MKKKVLVSGIQASGSLHIGNYFGAMKQNIELANNGEYTSYIFIADYHSMTTLQNREERMKSTFDIAAAYIACGLDPSVTLFKQSDVPQHTELAWILNTVTPMPMLQLSHAFKDSEAKNKDTNVGLFTYPVLMAADILMYNADVVPVGKDQEQHIEITREIAGKFNRAYNEELFGMPQAFIKKEVAIVPGTDGQKMSKSKGNTIPLFGTDEEVKKAVMGIVTDSSTPSEVKNPDENTIYHIHKLFLNDDEDMKLRAKFENGGYGYKEAKEELLATFMKWRKDKKEIYDDLHANPEKIYEVLSRGKESAQLTAEERMDTVRKLVGLTL